MIARYWSRTHPRRKGRPSRLDRDPEIRAFVEDRLDRMTLEQIVRECRDRFDDRAPSKSAVHRHWNRLRRRP